MRNVRDILAFFFSDRIYPAMRGAGMDCQDVFLVFHFDRDRVGNWLRVTAFAGLLGLWVLWIDSASSHNISFSSRCFIDFSTKSCMDLRRELKAERVRRVEVV
jgi:hypothetical protein